MNLKDAVVIITGGGTGVGAACAQVLAKHGARIIINYNKSQTGAVSYTHLTLPTTPYV